MTRATADSGIEELGQVPAGWAVSGLGRFTRLVSGAGFPPGEQGIDGEDVAFYKVNALGQADPDGVIRKGWDTISLATAQRLRAPLLPPGTIVLAKIGAALQLGRVRRTDRLSTIDNNMLAVIPSSNVDPAFLAYALQTFEFDALANPGAVPSLDMRAFRQRPTCFPLLEEQLAIADYLDRETAQIDAFIAKNEELITLLTERRASSIVEMVGNHNSIPLKRLVSSTRPLTYGILQCGEPVETGIPYIGPSDLPGEGASPALESLRHTTPEIAAAYSRSVLEGGDIVVSIGPAFGRVGLLSDDLAGANLTQDTVRVATMPEKVNAQYLVWVLSSRIADDYWDYEILGATFRRLNLGTLGETPIPYPSVDEQQRIAGEVAQAVAKIDRAIEVARSSVDLARERRAALISAAVTGKIDVGVAT